MKKTRKLVILALFLAPLTVSADMFSPSHSCSKPSKPFEFTSQLEIDSFMSDVESYKSCIMDFVEEQEDAIRKHKNATEEAIDEWNSFVDYELN